MPTVIEMPSLSSTMKQGKVVKWHRREGDPVKRGETLFEVETDKNNVEVDSVVSGFLRRILLQEGIEAPVKTPIAIMSESLEEDIASIIGTAPALEPSGSPQRHGDGQGASKAGGLQRREDEKRIKISPLARRMAEEHRLDIRAIKGTGPEGRITREDIERTVAEKAQPAPAGAQPVPAPMPAREVPALAQAEAERENRQYEDIGLTQMRRVIAQRLQQSKVTAPHFYVDMTADATALTQLKQDLQKRTETQGAKVSFDGILVKIAAHALKEFPLVNASFLDDRIRLYKTVNIGVAVAIDEGLVAPVVRNADQKSIVQISSEVAELAGKARNKKLLPDESHGGTFTITNLGMYGVETFHAIISPPESAILAVGAIIQKPVIVEGQIAVRPWMNLSLSIDHRVVDGALAARFLARIKEIVEAPLLMLS